MNFKELVVRKIESIGKKDQEEEPESLAAEEVELGLIREKNLGYWNYSTSKVIDGTSYTFSLDQESKDPTCYSLGFSVGKKQYFITNQGIGTFGRIIDEMSSLVEKVKNIEGKNFTSVVIGALGEAYTFEDFKSFKEQLQPFIEHPEILEGFSCQEGTFGDKEWGTIMIKDGTAFRESYIRHNSSAADEPKYDQESDSQPVGELFSDNAFVRFLMDDRSVTKKIEEFAHQKIELPSKNSRDKKAQRLMLYQRALETRFPHYSFEKKEERGEPLLVVHID